MLKWIVRNRAVWLFHCVYLQNVFTNHISNIYIKQDLVLNNQQWLICHQMKLNNWKKARWELHKDVVCFFKQIPVAPPPQNSGYMATYLPLLQIINVRWARHVWHCWRNQDELIIDIFQWIPIYKKYQCQTTSQNLLSLVMLLILSTV